MYRSLLKPRADFGGSCRLDETLLLQGVLGDVRHAFPGLYIDAGQKALAALTEADRVALCGVKCVPDPQLRGTRGSSTSSQVVLDGERIAMRRLRAHQWTIAN